MLSSLLVGAPFAASRQDGYAPSSATLVEITQMIDARLIDDLSQTLGRLLPPGVAELKDDFERNARSAVQGALGNLDLVTREEFDVQAQVLQRTRQRLQALEERVAALDGAITEAVGNAPDTAE